MIIFNKNMVVSSGKYLVGFIAFAITYILISVIAHLFVQFQNRDIADFVLTPYFVSFMSAIAATYSAIYIIERFIPDIKPRVICFIFFGIIFLLWLPPILGIFLALTGVIEAPIQSSTLWSKNTLPQLLQTITGIIFSWKLTNQN